jgi:hypothetical protein
MWRVDIRSEFLCTFKYHQYQYTNIGVEISVTQLKKIVEIISVVAVIVSISYKVQY